MVLLTQARQLRLPPSPSGPVSAIFSDPTSSSLALMHSDSSFSIYPSISPFSPTAAAAAASGTATVVSPPSSAAAFLRLHSAGTSRLIFVIAAPHLAGAAILLRFYMLRADNHFARVRVICNQIDLSFDEGKLGVLFSVNHGVSIKLAGSINVFAMHSVSHRKVWVFAVKIAGDGNEVKLMKTAVIDCDFPVFSISVSIGFLILGENHGIRVFPLRPLVKGRIRKEHRKTDKLDVQKINLPNGMIRGINGSSILYVNSGKLSVSGSKFMNVNSNIEENLGKHSDNTAKLKSVKMRQNDKEGGVRFVAFEGKEFKSRNLLTSVKAISIQILAYNKFMILDSVGDLYVLSLSGSESTCQMKRLTLAMKVQNLAVLPSDSTRAQTVWISDGHYTIHTMVVSDTDSPGNESDTKENEEKIQGSAIQVIFTSEKIQDIIPLSPNAILLLGQANNIFAYAIS